MLRKINRTGQLSIPKKVLASLQLHEGDYVDIEYADASILIKRANDAELSPEEYDKLADKLANVEAEVGLTFLDSNAARSHLKKMMK